MICCSFLLIIMSELCCGGLFLCGSVGVSVASLPIIAIKSGICGAVKYGTCALFSGGAGGIAECLPCLSAGGGCTILNTLCAGLTGIGQAIEAGVCTTSLSI
jgi:hypothetical protein